MTSTYDSWLSAQAGNPDGDPTYDELADSLSLAHSRIQGLESTLSQVREVVRRQQAIIQRMSTGTGTNRPTEG
jgi:hypothetical protein